MSSGVGKKAYKKTRKQKKNFGMSPNLDVILIKNLNYLLVKKE
jgi:hypothetical protein